jgi:hypothetical protein
VVPEFFISLDFDIFSGFFLSEGTFQTTRQSVAIVGGLAVLPCNTTAPGPNHPPILVIWYKNGGGDPVYRYNIYE